MEYKINTLLPIQFEKIENPPYLNDSRFQAVRCYVAHEFENYNGSYFDLSVLEAMGKYMAGVPIVGYISVNNVNEKDYKGHEEILVVDQDGVKIEYLGRAYGCIISNNDVTIVDRLHEDGKMRKYLCVTGVIWKMFADAIEIFDRDESKSHSMELQEDSIVGKFEKDGYYHFSEAKVRALCILGEGISPAMSNSVIEKFSQSNIDSSIQELLKEVDESIKQFSLQNHSSELEVDNINNQEGGSLAVDEKLELLKKYNLTIEQLNFNIEEFELEELENKLKDFSENINLENKELTEFSKTYRQKRDALNATLKPIIIKDENGRCVSETYFYLADFSDEYMFVEKDYWDANTYESTNGRFAYVFNENDGTAVITSEFEKMIAEVWLTEEEYKNLEEQRNASVQNYEQLKSEFEEYKNNFSTPNTEVEVLQSFQDETLKTQRQEQEAEIFSRYDEVLDIEDESYKSIKENKSEFSIEQLEEKLAVIFARKQIKFSNDRVTGIIKLGGSDGNSRNSEVSPYGDLFEKHAIDK